MDPRERPSGTGLRSWGIVGAAIGGLLLAIAVAAIVLFVVNERVKDVTERALRYDVELEDEGDDLRVAVLLMRHYHRNLVFFDGTTDLALANFDQAYRDLLEEIGELERVPLGDFSGPQPTEIRALAERYYADFLPAIALRDNDRPAFDQASAEGLRRLDELDAAAEEIDDHADRLADDSLVKVDEEATTERFILVALVAGVALVGVVLAVTAGRILTRLQASYVEVQAAYAEVQATAQELARALQTKTDFIADASHELRTPLTVIRASAQLGLGASEEQARREMLAEISAEATRMSKLVDDLLFLARSDTGLPPLEKELVPARWLITQLAKPAGVLARQRASCLTVDPGGEGYLEVDPERVEQAVLILVDNAAKHAPPGTCVALTARVQDGELAIEVADAGPGISPEEVPLIFDRFYQVGNRRARKKDGSGLGLSIAKTIVEAHGGSIGVDSRINGGTRMTVRIPLCAAPEVAATSEETLVPA